MQIDWEESLLFDDCPLLLLELLRFLQSRYSFLIPLDVRLLVLFLNATLLVDHGSECALLELFQLLIEGARGLLDLLAFSLAEFPKPLMSRGRPHSFSA